MVKEVERRAGRLLNRSDGWGFGMELRWGEVLDVVVMYCLCCMVVCVCNNCSTVVMVVMVNLCVYLFLAQSVAICSAKVLSVCGGCVSASMVLV